MYVGQYLARKGEGRRGGGKGREEREGKGEEREGEGVKRKRRGEGGTIGAKVHNMGAIDDCTHHKLSVNI